MRIEITVEGVEPVIHRLTKEKTLVGSGTDCDIQVTAEGMSRKHAAILAKDDQYFVVDQGSTNGTFVNESRLVPGQRADFNSFFPVKLGHAVTMALLADEEGAPKFELSKSITETPGPAIKKVDATVTPPNKKTTDTGSFKQVTPAKSAKTAAGVMKAKKAAPILETNSKEDQERMRNTKIIAFIVLVGGLAYYYFQKEAPVETAVEVAVEEKAAVPKMKVSELKLPDPLPSDLGSIQNYTGLAKCLSSEIEKALCSAMGLPLEKVMGSGIRRENDVIQIFLPSLVANEFKDEIATKLNVSELYRDRLNQIVLPNDVIDLFLGRIDPIHWKTYSEGARWVVIVFLDASNVAIGNAWFAPVTGVTTVYESPEYGTRTDSYNNGTLLLSFIGGLFRAAVP